MGLILSQAPNRKLSSFGPVPSVPSSSTSAKFPASLNCSYVEFRCFFPGKSQMEAGLHIGVSKKIAKLCLSAGGSGIQLSYTRSSNRNFKFGIVFCLYTLDLCGYFYQASPDKRVHRLLLLGLQELSREDLCVAEEFDIPDSYSQDRIMIMMFFGVSKLPNSGFRWF